MLKTALKYFVELTGNPYSSSLLKNFSKSSLSKPLIRPFANAYRIERDEMSQPIHKYKSLHAFFTRELKNGIRPIDESPTSLISPVDGVVEYLGPITKDKHFFVKNQMYTLDRILGSSERAKNYENGHYFILYLSPSNYHRFHYPIGGKLLTRYALGERSYPVNQLGMRFGDFPFATNYRIISELACDFGKIAMVKVGALNVNSIVLSHSTSTFTKGEELGYFSFGSTVILFVEENAGFQPIVREKSPVKLGEPIATWEK